MRVLILVALVMVLSACAALRDDMRRAEDAFDQARYEQVEVWLSDLELSVADMDRPMRARFYYLRGTSAYRLGDTRRARHFLALCREEAEEQGLGLRSEWRVNLDKLQREIEINRNGTSGGPDSKPPKG